MGRAKKEKERKEEKEGKAPMPLIDFGWYSLLVLTGIVRVSNLRDMLSTTTFINIKTYPELSDLTDHCLGRFWCVLVR